MDMNRKSTKIKRSSHTPLFFVMTILLLLSSCKSLPDFHYSFENEKDLDSLEWKCGTVFSLSGEHATSGEQSLKAEFYPTPKGSRDIYPGLTLKNFNPDWSDYDVLCFDVYNPEETTVPLAIRIDDRDNPTYADRFNRKIALDPGEKSIKIPLANLITSGAKQQLRLSQIDGISLFLVDPWKKNTLYFDSFRLE